MMRTTGFLVGVCLTVAAFLLVLDTRENQRPDISAETIADPTPEELSAMVSAIAQQVDVVQAETGSDVQLLSDTEPGMTDAEPQSSIVEAIEEGTPKEPSEMSTAIIAEADVVQAGNEPDITVTAGHVLATPDDQPQKGFEASSLELNNLSVNQSNTGTYLFWSPFRSTWAAQGFAGRLTLATQVPVDVVNTGPGKYRVAFSFQDETERVARIERIETITGLKLE